ncbi:MAG: hypothetical protein U0234_32060 [Sandaracinus sp.]
MKYGAFSLVLLLAASSVASAQDVNADITSARVALENGDLLGAGTAVDHGLASAPLTEVQLASLYELRALLAYADDRLGALEEALHALASLGASTPSLFPPPLRVRYDEVRASAGPIALTLELVTEIDGDRRRVRLVPRVHDDAGRLIQSVRVRAAIDDGGLAPRAESDVIDLGNSHRSVEVRYVLEALGPGGTTVATRGSEDAPEIEILDAIPVDQTFLHVTLVTVAAVLVASAVAFGMAYLATDGFTAGQPTTLGPVSCSGAACATLLSF